MKTIKVYGQLKKFLGQSTFNFDVCTASQAIKALCANFKGLEKWLIDNDQNGIAYKVKVGTEEIGEDNITDLALPLGTKEIFSIRFKSIVLLLNGLLFFVISIEKVHSFLLFLSYTRPQLDFVVIFTL